MTDDERLRVMLDAGILVRQSGESRRRLWLGLALVIGAVLVTASDPSRWWIFVIPLGVLLLLPRRARHDELVRLAVLEFPDDVFEITHHRGEPTPSVRMGGLGGMAASAALRRATRDQFHVWIQLVSGAYAAFVLDPVRGAELVKLLSARCPHVAVRHGLPSGVSGFDVE